MVQKKHSTPRNLFNIGAVMAGLGVIGLFLAMYFESEGAPVSVLKWAVELGATSSLNVFETVAVYLALYRMQLLIFGGAVMLAGYVLRQPGDFDDLKNGAILKKDPQPRADAPVHRPEQPVRRLRVSQSHRHSQPVVYQVQQESRTLRGEAGGLAGRSFRLTDKLVIGRDPARCQVAFPAGTKGVSGVHCTVRLRYGRVTVTDENSTYGTYVDGRRIPAGKTVTMHRGQRLQLGSSRQTLSLHS